MMSESKTEEIQKEIDKEVFVKNECNLPREQLKEKINSYYGVKYKVLFCCDFHNVFVPQILQDIVGEING